LVLDGRERLVIEYREDVVFAAPEKARWKARAVNDDDARAGLIVGQADDQVSHPGVLDAHTNIEVRDRQRVSEDDGAGHSCRLVVRDRQRHWESAALLGRDGLDAATLPDRGHQSYQDHQGHEGRDGHRAHEKPAKSIHSAHSNVYEDTSRTSQACCLQ